MTRTMLAIAPGALGAATFSRGSTAAYYDINGVLQTAAANVVRDAHYEQGVRTILLEGSGTNALGFSEQFDNAAWGKTASTVTPNATAAPDGTTTADKLVESATNASHFLSRNLTLTAGAVQSASIFVKAGERTKGVFYLTNVDRVGVSFDLAAGTVAPFNSGVGALRSSRITALGNGWYRIAWAGTLNPTATAASIAIQLADATGATGYLGDGASGFFIWGLDPEKDAALPSSYIATPSAAAVTRSPDLIGWTIPDAPHAMEWVVEFFEHGNATAPLGSRGTLAYLGNDAHSSATVRMDGNGAGYNFRHNNGTTEVVSSPVTTIPIGARVTMRGVLYSDGSVEGFLAVNGAAEVSGGRSAANPFASQWGGQTFRLNSFGTVQQGNAAYLSATLTDTSVPRPSITFTDDVGPVTVYGLWPTFGSWLPAFERTGDTEPNPWTGVIHQYDYRTDYTASFTVPRIAPSKVGDVLRLIAWLTDGGQVTVNTYDAAIRSYVCTLKPGTTPTLSPADPAGLEYTLSLSVRNTQAAPMLCLYPGTR